MVRQSKKLDIRLKRAYLPSSADDGVRSGNHAANLGVAIGRYGGYLGDLVIARDLF